MAVLLCLLAPLGLIGPPFGKREGIDVDGGACQFCAVGSGPWCCRRPSRQGAHMHKVFCVQRALENQGRRAKKQPTSIQYHVETGRRIKVPMLFLGLPRVYVKLDHPLEGSDTHRAGSPLSVTAPDQACLCLKHYYYYLWYSSSSACRSLPRKSEGLHCIAFFLTSVQSYQAPVLFPVPRPLHSLLRLISSHFN
jgi:hypothetical protein